MPTAMVSPAPGQGPAIVPPIMAPRTNKGSTHPGSSPTGSRRSAYATSARRRRLGGLSASTLSSSDRGDHKATTMRR